MSTLKKVFLVKLPNGTINLIPLEEIQGCEIISPNPKLGFWIHEKTTPGGASDGLGSEVKVRDIEEEDIEEILKNKGECFVEVDHEVKLAMPTNGYGYKKVVIHLERKV